MGVIRSGRMRWAECGTNGGDKECIKYIGQEA